MRLPAETGIITDIFGMRIHPVQMVKKMHNGIDIAMVLKTKLVAVEDGVITINKNDKDYGGGWYIELKGDSGYSYRYFHLFEQSPVKVNQKVREGELIALSGGVGGTNSSTGEHLHFECMKDGKYIDPFTNPKLFPNLRQLPKRITGITIDETNEKINRLTNTVKLMEKALKPLNV